VVHAEGGREYELGKTLGKGHFSKVKLGVHVRTRKQVAIKVMGVSPVAVWSPPPNAGLPAAPLSYYRDWPWGGGGLYPRRRWPSRGRGGPPGGTTDPLPSPTPSPPERKALAEEGMEEQLKREIAIMRKLDHPHVTRLPQGGAEGTMAPRPFGALSPAAGGVPSQPLAPTRSTRPTRTSSSFSSWCVLSCVM